MTGPRAASGAPPRRSATQMQTVYLTFDDAVGTQFSNAVPVLREFGFGATFFITRFGRAWRDAHADTLLSGDQLRDIAAAGFEIGNHTLTHPSLDSLSDDEIRREISDLDSWLAKLGIARPASFAYPGGPYSERGARILREMGFRRARTVEDPLSLPRPWDPLRIPSIALDDSRPASWARALETLDAGIPLALCYHGTPDRVHPWVNTEAASFRSQMEELARRRCAVLPLSAFRPS